MKTTDKTKQVPTVTLNSLPLNQVFRGTIISKSGRLTGVFLKTADVVGGLTTKDGKGNDVVVVKLDPPYTNPGYVNVILTCYPVENYEALEAELVVTPLKG